MSYPFTRIHASKQGMMMGFFDDDSGKRLGTLLGQALASANMNLPQTPNSAFAATTNHPGNWLAQASTNTANSSVSQRWEEKIVAWSQDPSATEQERIDRTIRMVTEAINDDAFLSTLQKEVFLQGSYRNQTNTRLDSDIDVCVVFTQVAYHDQAPMLRNPVSIGTAQHHPVDLKERLRAALASKFDARSVKAGPKAIFVKPSTVRVDADVVAAVAYLYHFTNANGDHDAYIGTAIPVGSGFATNFPHHHYRVGLAKDIETNGAYKKMVRFFKRMNQEFDPKDQLPSFYIESLIFNCDRDCFFKPTYYAIATAILEQIRIVVTSTYPPLWLEANGMKRLWHQCILRGGNFNIGDAERFINRAKREMGL